MVAVVGPLWQGMVGSSTEPDHGWQARSRWAYSSVVQHSWDGRGDGIARSCMQLLRQAAL